MPSRREVKRSYLKVGVLIVVALSAVAALALLISGDTGEFFPGKLKVRAYFKNSTGLKIGSPVNLDGVTIGNVRAIRIVAHPRATPVEVEMVIGDKFRHDLLTDSRANIRTIGVLGSTVVDIDNRQAHGNPIAMNGVLLTGGRPNLQDALRSFQKTNQKLSTTLNRANVLMSNLSSNKGSIGKLINDPTLRNRAAAAVKELSAIPTQVSDGKGTIGKFMTDDSLMNHLKDMQAKLSDISTDIHSGKGTVGKFMKDPALGKNLKEASKQFREISAEVHSGQGAVGMMVSHPAFRKKLQDTGAQLSAIGAQVSAGKGTIGQMRKNPSFDKHLKDLMGNTKKLVKGFRKHPFKYVAIRFRIF